MCVCKKIQKMKYIIPIIISAAFLITSCAGNGSKTGEAAASVESNSIADTLSMPKYAKGFTTSVCPDGTVLLSISDPEQSASHVAEVWNFALAQRGSDATVPEGYTRIDVPIDRAICMTSLQLSNFIALGETEKIAGVTSTRHLFNDKMKAQLKSGMTKKIGIEGNFDNEVVMALRPDVILISPFKRGGYEALRDAGSPLMPHLGYKEPTPLGQAEWIKVAGLLTGRAEDAAEKFDSIAARYNRLRDLAAEAAKGTKRPSVMSGEMRGGNWYAVGGKSFLAQLINDAGGEYFLKDNNETGGVTLDYESIFRQAANADYWRIVNSHEVNYSYEALRAQDERYTAFKAFKERGVIYSNMKEVPFYESMPVEPDEVLADFIAVFHPSIVAERKPRYYHLLK